MENDKAGESVSVAPLDDFRVVIISGQDRVEFLQGQLTQDVATLATTGTALAGWASAKGRLLATGQLIAADDEIWWPLPADIVAGVARRLQMFVLRAAVKIEVSALPVAGLFGVGGLTQLRIAGETVALENHPARLADGSLTVRVAGDPARAWLIGPAATAIGEHGEPVGMSTTEPGWLLQSIRAGLPTIVAATQEMFVPQMLNLDRIGAISFDKGCYVGQEIVARTQNLGRIKRRMYRFNTDDTVTLAPGDTIYGSANTSGKIVLADNATMSSELLAVVPIDAASNPWFADETRRVAMTGQPLPYQMTE